MSSLRKNILATLAYYDVLHFPLTTLQVYQYLMNYHNFGEREKVVFSSVYLKLEELCKSGEVEKKNGFWFLPGRSALVTERIHREKISVAKLKRMQRLVRILRHLPFIRMIAATGSLSFRYGTRGSDWDMLIVLQEKALFTGRMILTIFLQIIGKRRHGAKIVDRACLNYFTGDKSLTVRLKDWYAAHEYQVMIPLFQTFSRDAFFRANEWLLEYRPHHHLPITANRLQVKDTSRSLRVRSFLEKISSFSFLEKKLAHFQKEKIARNPYTKKSGACIIADDKSLVFFPSPRGPKVFEKFQEKLTF